MHSAPLDAGPHGTAPRSLADRLDGLLFFPVTPFTRTADGSGRVDLDVFAEHLKSRLAFLDTARPAPGAVFVCCGTVEFFSVDLAEYAECVRVAVEVAAGRVPVVAGIGYGAALAAGFADAAKTAGADGLLVMPPYLVSGDAAGLRDHYTAMAGLTDLDVIIYQRDNVTFSPEAVADLAEVPNIVGFKDGKGDLDLMQRIVSAVRDRHGEGKLLYLNGLPTAEMSQLAYGGIGVAGYSSAVFCFAPDIALAFYHAYRDGSSALVNDLLDRFYRPFVELRGKGVGRRTRGAQGPRDRDARMSPATAGEPVAAAGSGPVVTRIVITPVAMKDPPLLNASGVHEPYALRSIIELHTDSGIVGISEAYGDDPTLAQLGAAAAVLPGLDVFHLNELAGRRPRHPRGLLPRDQGPDSPAPRPPGGTSAASTS